MSFRPRKINSDDVRDVVLFFFRLSGFSIRSPRSRTARSGGRCRWKTSRRATPGPRFQTRSTSRWPDSLSSRPWPGKTPSLTRPSRWSTGSSSSRTHKEVRGFESWFAQRLVFFVRLHPQFVWPLKLLPLLQARTAALPNLNLAKCSSYLGPGGREESHSCPFTDLAYKLNSTLKTIQL